VNVVGELQPKRTPAASRGFLAAAQLSCYTKRLTICRWPEEFYHATSCIADTDMPSIGRSVQLAHDTIRYRRVSRGLKSWVWTT